MKCGKLGECIISQSNIKEIDYEEKLNEILTGVNKKKEETEKNRKEEEIMNKRLKEIENERKVDYFLNKNKNSQIDYNTTTIEVNNNHSRNNIEVKDNEIDKYLSSIGEQEYLTNSPPQLELKDLIKPDTNSRVIGKRNRNNQLKHQATHYNSHAQSNTKQKIDAEEEVEEIIIQMKVKPQNIMKTQIKIDDFTRKIIQSKKNANESSIINDDHSIKRANTISLSSASANDNQSRLLLEYEKEKEIGIKLSTILYNNESVLNNTQFTNVKENNIKTNQHPHQPQNNNSFYQIGSKEDKLLQAKQLLEQKLTPKEKEVISNASRELLSLNQEYSFRVKERKELEQSVQNTKNEYSNFKSNVQKELEIIERKYTSEIKGIINKYKLDLYQNELKPTAERYIQKEISSELASLEDQLNTIQKKSKEKESVFTSKSNSILNQIHMIQTDNKALMKKIKAYEENRLWNEIDNPKSLTNTVSQLTCCILSENNNNVSPSVNINNNQKKKKDKKCMINIIDDSDDNDDNMLIKPRTQTSKVRALTQKTEVTKQETNESNKSNEPIEDFELKFKDKYHNNNEVVIKEDFYPNGIISKEYSKGKKELLFPSGQRKELFPDGYQIVYYINGDIKQIYPNKAKEIYYYLNQKALQVKYSDGRNYIKFEDGHIEAIQE